MGEGTPKTNQGALLERVDKKNDWGKKQDEQVEKNDEEIRLEMEEILGIKPTDTSDDSQSQ